MRVSVAKFGGSTTNDGEKLRLACSTIASFVEGGNKVIAVISAVRGATNTLMETIDTINVDNFREYISRCIEELRRLHAHSSLYSEDLSDLERQFSHFVKSDNKAWMRDNILVKGEEYFSKTFVDKLNDKGVTTELINFDNPHFPTIVHGYFGNARSDLITTKAECERIEPRFKEYDCICVPGYGGIDKESGRVKTLRRGGSDAVATALS
jgi:aspartokinase